MSGIAPRFVLTAESARRLRRRLAALGAGTGRLRRRRLRFQLYDTEDRALRGEGLALRLRREGKSWVQSVLRLDAAPGRRAGASAEAVCEAPARGGRPDLAAIPDPVLRLRIEALVAGRPLVPVCETTVERAAAVLELEPGLAAEVAVEACRIRADGDEAAFHELALEGPGEGRHHPFRLAADILAGEDLRFSLTPLPHRERLMLDEGRADPPAGPRPAEAVPLAEEWTAERAAQAVLRECFAQVAANVEAVKASDAPEGPHQLRVGLRRLRSALSLFGPAIGGPETDRLGEEAKWLGQETGRLRDLDVLAGELLAPEAAAHPDEPGFAPLAAVLARAAAAQRDALRQALAGERARQFLLDLARFIETRGWVLAEDIAQSSRLAMPVRELALAALARRWKKAARRARGLETLNVAERHELRKELKKLRYAGEFLAPLFPGRGTERFLKRLKALQDIFGELNDAALAESLLAGGSLLDGQEAAVHRAAGRLIGARLARAEIAWAGARERWHELSRRRPFWE
ncbi:MAG: CHAD domain-containing protein [Rhodobacteraceae bacterium]|nr:CHAD domain-containing protein [Paracoccaceae bacterium]